MLGTREEPGIMFRTLHDLFIEISKTSDSLLYQVSMSYLEIYNELIRDLLNPSSGFLELREDAKGGVQVAGISEKVADTPEEVMHMLHKGNKERTQEPTKANKTSSRSHAVLQVNIKQRNKIRTHAQEMRLGKLYMIDLAGSERAAHTQNTGKRMVEGAHINRSLLALGNCINALSEKSNTKYVNYRDSKLTRILKDSLGGNSKTVMIAHVSPASIHFEESRNTLVYADRAKYIRTKLRRNVIDVSYHISQYQQIIQELAQEIATLKEQRSDLETKISHLDPRNGLGNTEDKHKLEEALKLRESLIQSFKEQIKLRKNILELDNSIMDLNIEMERHNRLIDKHESFKENDQSHMLKPEDQRALKNAKEELKVVENEKDELEAKRKATLKDYEQLKNKLIKLRDQIAKKLNNKEQREILNLLCKNFEFEMKNLEKQAEIFQRDHIIRDKDLVILRLEQHRSLCDTLIYQQRKLIQDNLIELPQDLNELFYLYSKDVNEGQLMKDISGLTQVSNTRVISPKASPGAITFLTQIEEEDGSNETTHEHRINDPAPLFPSPWSKRNLVQAIENSSDPDKVFYKTNKASLINKNKKELNRNATNTNSTPTSIPHFSFNKNSKTNRNNSMLSTSTNDSHLDITIENGSNQTKLNTHTSHSISNIPSQTSSQNNRKIKNKHTQGIAAVAAQRKATQHHRDLMLELGQQPSVSSTSGAELDTKLTTSRLAKHDQLLNILNSTNNSIVNNSKNLDESLSEKKSTILTDGSNRAKKTVKIQDKVKFQVKEDLNNVN
jgi:kinesin family member 18/19